MAAASGKQQVREKVSVGFDVGVSLCIGGGGGGGGRVTETDPKWPLEGK